MRIVFMGTPSFAVPSLSALAEAGEVTLVVTRPDAIRGRGRKLVASPVKERALELGCEVCEASRVDASLTERIALAKPDVICVAAYGAILPDELLTVAPLGCVNVHASLLPRWRGAAPIQRAILAGDAEVGVSIMRIAHDLDAGAYCRQAALPVGESSCEELTAALGELGARELVSALADMEAGTAVWQEQDEAEVTFAPKVTKAELTLDPTLPAQVCARLVQASSDTAPARASIAGRGLRVMRARVADADADAGAVVPLGRKRVLLGCAEGSLELLSVKPDGKREMPVASWAQGLRGQASTWQRG